MQTQFFVIYFKNDAKADHENFCDLEQTDQEFSSAAPAAPVWYDGLAQKLTMSQYPRHFILSPQETVLFPLLYSLYTAGILKFPNTKLRLYDDAPLSTHTLSIPKHTQA